MTRRLLIPVLALVAILVLGGAAAGYVYFFSGLRSSPAALSFASPSPAASATSSTSASPTPAATATGFAGSWQVASGSIAGYRVKEQFVGQTSTHEAVARTNAVTGQIAITQAGSTYQLSSGTITVDLSGLASIDSVAGYNVVNRDRIVQQALQTGQFPTATLLLSPVAIPSAAAGGQTVSLQVTGSLTIHGVTKPVTATVQLRVAGGVPQVVASVQTNMTDFGVSPPSIGFTTVQPAVTIEAQIAFSRA